MHRTLQITVPAAATDALLGALQDSKHVMGLSVSRGASLKPPGDVVTVHTLNRGADEVLQHVEAAREHGDVSVVTEELTSIIDPQRGGEVEDDVDEGLWEEIETGLRHQARVTGNYLMLMALGGAVAAAGLISEPVPQAMAFVAASVIAPGFEPIAKIPLALVLRRWNVLRRALRSIGLGYLTLMAGAALSFMVLRLTGETSVHELAHNPEVARIAHPSSIELLVSACGALAGVTMMAAYRRHVIAGPLIAMVMVPAMALAGAAATTGRMDLVLQGIERFLMDGALIIVLGALMFWWKQARVHHRLPMT